MDQKNNLFTVFGVTIEEFSLYYGIFLIVWGVVISLLSGSSSYTSYIPSYLGVIIFIFSYLSLKFVNKKKLFMHIAATVGLITMLGGLDILRIMLKGNLFGNFWADLSKLMMLITGGLFVYNCFSSFKFARKINNL